MRKKLSATTKYMSTRSMRNSKAFFSKAIKRLPTSVTFAVYASETNCRMNMQTADENFSPFGRGVTRAYFYE